MIPPKNATGTNTAHRTSDEAIRTLDTSDMVFGDFEDEDDVAIDRADFFARADDGRVLVKVKDTAPLGDADEAEFED